MKQEKYTNKEGEEKVNNILEHGDVFIANQSKPKKFEGKFVNYSLNANYNGQQIYIQLTKGQGEFFDRFDIQPGTVLRGENYTNSYGTFVGIGFNKQKETTEQKVETTEQKETKANNLLKEPDEGITLTEKEQEIYDQIGKIAEKDRSKVTKDAFITTMSEMANVTTERATEIYDKMFL